MIWIFVLLTVLAGTLVPLQAGINASLRLSTGSPIFAAITNFSVGWTLLVGFVLIARVDLPAVGEIAKVPWWQLVGGAMGACLVLSGVFLAHRLGAAVFMTAIILGQLSASVLLDHFGWVGYAAHAASPMRLLGIGFLALGVYLVRVF